MAGLANTPAWRALAKHRDELKTVPLRDLVLADPQRLARCGIAAAGLGLNYALQPVTSQTIDLLVKLAVQEKLEDRRTQMLRGEKINNTENRAALHMALRQRTGSVMLDGHDVIKDVREVRERMARFADEVRKGKWKGATGKPIRHVVNIGIGGSDLGPRLAVEALAPYATGPKLHFVANADAFELLQAVKDLNPAETLFLVVSKTFTTEETLLNARTARHWLTDKLGDKATARHFVAVSANADAAEKFGIAAENIFPVWDWVGGRFSLWSAVGLSIMLAIGSRHFDVMLDGAAAMDEHFKTASLAENMPVMLGLLGIWQRDFCDARALAVLPYSERLRDLPRYLQQLEMESNGKGTTRDGAPAGCKTAPAVFGECGTISQHSFHQWLHQGSDIIATDFIGVAEDDLAQPDHHKALRANMAAQMTALAFGQKSEAPHENYAGGRASNLIRLDRLDPFCFGALLALYEHKVFVQGAIWDLNSFDQPGVELGKRLAKGLEKKKRPESGAEAFLADLFRTTGTPSGKP